jgi:hypothetical protein
MAKRSAARRVRRGLPWVVVLGAAPFAVRAAGQALAERSDFGDETSSELRRVQALGSVILRPSSASLSHLRFDLALAGLDLDLTDAQPAPGGTDLELNCVLAGANIRVPSHWKVSSDFSGVGAIDLKRMGHAGIAEAPEEADLRVHMRAVLAGGTVGS